MKNKASPPTIKIGKLDSKASFGGSATRKAVDLGEIPEDGSYASPDKVKVRKMSKFNRMSSEEFEEQKDVITMAKSPAKIRRESVLMIPMMSQ